MSENEQEPELLPCPFCGNPVSNRSPMDTVYTINKQLSVWKVACSDCGASVLGDSKDEAIQMWNTRNPAPPSRDKVEGLVEAVRVADVCHSDDDEWMEIRKADWEQIFRLAALSATKEEGRG